MKYNHREIIILLNFRLAFLLGGSVLAEPVSNILILGDSMGEFMGKTLESFCSDVTVENAGIGGTTADQWTKATAQIISECTATTDVASTSWDAVYISVGGNDLLLSDCTIRSDELVEKIESAVKNIVLNVAPGASTYLLTGYCVPHAPEDESESSGCSKPSDYNALSDAFAIMQTNGINVDELNGTNSSDVTIEVIDSSNACGASSSSFSNQMYFQDPIHLNSKGYCKVFTQAAVQNALSCSNGTPQDFLDCESIDFDIYGLDGNCATGTDENSAYLIHANAHLLISFTVLFMTMLSESL